MASQPLGIENFVIFTGHITSQKITLFPNSNKPTFQVPEHLSRKMLTNFLSNQPCYFLKIIFNPATK